MVTQESLDGKLPTPKPDVIDHGVAHCLEVLGNVSVGENSRIEEFVRVKEKRCCLLKKGMLIK